MNYQEDEHHRITLYLYMLDFYRVVKMKKAWHLLDKKIRFQNFFYITNLYEIRCCKDLVKNNMIKHVSQKIILHWALLMWFWEDFGNFRFQGFFYL